MQYIKDKDIYKVARITGPTHNLLAIRLSNERCSTQVTSLPIKRGDVERLDEHEVLTQVLAGLDEINKVLDKEYFISEVQFVPSDTGPVSIYEFLVKELIMRINSKGEFVLV
jgi:hypothetical protein